MDSHHILYSGLLDGMIMLTIVGPTSSPLVLPNHVAGTLFKLKLFIDISVTFIFIKSALL
jgi:hypothetical protein